MALICMAWLAVAGSVAADETWTEIKGRHFVVLHQGDSAQAERVQAAAEEYYRSVADRLQITRYGDFWLWDRRVKIYLYGKRDAFARATGAPDWACGKADYARNEIRAVAGVPEFEATVLPHEIGHLAFRSFVGFQSDVPQWLDEGVAQWLEDRKRGTIGEVARWLVRNGARLPLGDLTVLRVGGDTPTEVAHLFYAQAMTVTGMMIERFGADKFRIFCGHLRDGKTLDDALRFTYPGSMRSIAELETAWLKWLKDKTETDAVSGGGR